MAQVDFLSATYYLVKEIAVCIENNYIALVIIALTFYDLTHFFIKWPIPGLFFFSSFNTVDSKYSMTGFEPRTSGIGSDRSTN